MKTALELLWFPSTNHYLFLNLSGDIPTALPNCLVKVRHAEKCYLMNSVSRAKRKSKVLSLTSICFQFFRTKSMHSIVWNPQLVAAWNLALASMESRTKGDGEYSLSADAIRGRAAIPYNSLCELMPYQALRSWINKKTNRSSSFYFGGPTRTRT